MVGTMHEHITPVTHPRLAPGAPSSVEAEEMLDRLERVSEAFHLHTLEPRIEACRRILRDDQGVVNVAVVGRFRAGKSSFTLAAAEAGERARADLEALLDGELRHLEQVRREIRLLAGDHESRARETLGRRFMASPQGEEFLAELVTRAEERPRVEEALRELELTERILPSGHGDQGATP